jgi:hypothetical protein
MLGSCDPETSLRSQGALRRLPPVRYFRDPSCRTSRLCVHGDAQTPDPSFTTVQYKRLALLYIIASVRAGHWLIPAFHAAIDGHIPNGHDDPLNFDINSFAAGLEKVMSMTNNNIGV